MSGKMSLGMRRMVVMPTITMSRAITTNVYGRARARRTIHIGVLQRPSIPGAAACDMSTALTQTIFRAEAAVSAVCHIGSTIIGV